MDAWLRARGPETDDVERILEENERIRGWPLARIQHFLRLGTRVPLDEYKEEAYGVLRGYGRVGVVDSSRDLFVRAPPQAWTPPPPPPEKHIPLLCRSAFVAGSRHTVQTPERVAFDVSDDGAVSVEWRATGSKLYAVTARGRLRTGRTKLRWGVGNRVTATEGLEVCCSCPDAERQTWPKVCKHAFAALSSVVDPDARWKLDRLTALLPVRELLQLRSLYVRSRALPTDDTPCHFENLLALPNGVVGVVVSYWAYLPPKRPPKISELVARRIWG